MFSFFYKCGRYIIMMKPKTNFYSHYYKLEYQIYQRYFVCNFFFFFKKMIKLDQITKYNDVEFPVGMLYIRYVCDKRNTFEHFVTIFLKAVSF